VDQLITFLDAHGGSVIVLVTAAYVVITLLLLFEARATRAAGNAANLDVHPRPYGPVNVELVLENYGPAIAKSVRFRRWIEVDGATVAGTDRTQAEPMFPVGRRRRFLVTASETRIDSLQELSDTNAALHAEWQWTDGRRTLGLRTLTHRASVSYLSEDLRAGFYGGWALVESDPIEREEQAREEAKKIRTALEDIAKTLSTPAMTAYLHKMMVDAAVRRAARPAKGKQPPRA
jgi:hypothetical protein